jgi:hypothetical protein
MRVQPENLTEVWEGAKRDILASHPKLSETRAAELAAARVFNWFHEDWATFSDQVSDAVKNPAGSPKEIDPQRRQLYEKLTDWTPLYELQHMSGSRNLLRDLEHPIVIERSIAPDEVVRIRNHWRTERMEARLETLSDLKEAWGNIRAEFRGRAKGEGCLYTNSQGIHAIKTAFELLQEQPYSGRVDALTTNLSGAAEAIEYFKDMAEVLGGKAGAGVSHLADVFKEAILDAVTNKREGFAAVDTTVPGDKDDPPLTYLKKLVRHEATHVWQYTINHKSPGLLSDKVIKADPDYPRLKRAFSAYYENIKPNEVVAEAVAFVVAGDWKRAGFTNEERGLKFINRFFSNVVIRYGEKALDGLRLTHPKIKEVMENVRNIPDREFGSGRETEKDIGSGPESVAEGSGNDSEATRSRETIRSTKSSLAGGWIGEDVGSLRGDGPEPGTPGSCDQKINRLNEDLIKSLQTIADIESSDPDGMRYTWRGLAIESAMIAREALAYHEIHTGNFEVLSDGRSPGTGAFSNSGANRLVEALHEIANVEFLDPGQYSWKDRAVMAGTIAREALSHFQLQREPGQEESLSYQAVDLDKNAPSDLSLSNILSDGRSESLGLDRGCEENDYDQYFSF